MGVLNLSHDQVSALLTVHHDRKPCVVSLRWIIIGIWLIYVHWLFLARDVSAYR